MTLLSFAVETRAGKQWRETLHETCISRKTIATRRGIKSDYSLQLNLKFAFDPCNLERTLSFIYCLSRDWSKHTWNASCDVLSSEMRSKQVQGDVRHVYSLRLLKFDARTLHFGARFCSRLIVLLSFARRGSSEQAVTWDAAPYYCWHISRNAIATSTKRYEKRDYSLQLLKFGAHFLQFIFRYFIVKQWKSRVNKQRTYICICISLCISLRYFSKREERIIH